jgi:N-acetylglucosaminyldiphosphoundecaprenol N-acetyl-beta-D-mannosaminyltransferase
MDVSMNEREVVTVSLLATPLVVTDYRQLLDFVSDWALRAQPTSVDFCNTQIVTMRRTDASFKQITSTVDYFIPDGMPLIWCLRAMGASIHDRIYGPTFMRHALIHEKRLRHYFLGGSEETLRKLIDQAQILSEGQFQLAGFRHGYFTPSDNQGILDEINRLSPDVVWVGLGTPKQQQWVSDNKSRIARGVLLAVGFAFDVNAGTKKDAPLWMQKLSLTWVFRISQEPRRLLGRYLKFNTWFVLLCLVDLTRHLTRRNKISKSE